MRGAYLCRSHRACDRGRGRDRGRVGDSPAAAPEPPPDCTATRRSTCPTPGTDHPTPLKHNGSHRSPMRLVGTLDSKHRDSFTDIDGGNYENTVCHLSFPLSFCIVFIVFLLRSRQTHQGHRHTGQQLQKL